MCVWFAGTFRRDFCRTLHMFGTHHCCYSSSLCLSEMCELVPASAGAERRTVNIECAVRALRPASDVAWPAATWRILPNIASALPQIRGYVTRRFQADAVSCRLDNDNANWVYTLPSSPGVYDIRQILLPWQTRVREACHPSQKNSIWHSMGSEYQSTHVYHPDCRPRTRPLDAPNIYHGPLSGSSHDFLGTRGAEISETR